MPTVGELFHSLDRDAVIAAIFAAYPDEPGERDAYEQAWGEIVTLQPTPRGLRCVVTYYAENDFGWDVSGVDAEGTHFAIEFTPWAEWLEMPVAVVGAERTPEQTLAHILWEMTFAGFTQAEIAGDLEEICDRVDEVKAMLGDDAKRAN